MVERGKVVLAEFLYGAKVAPTLPLIDSTKANGLGWLLKTRGFPVMYFELMLKGREWLAKPQRLPHQPTAQDTPPACDFVDSSSARK